LCCLVFVIDRKNEGKNKFQRITKRTEEIFWLEKLNTPYVAKDYHLLEVDNTRVWIRPVLRDNRASSRLRMTRNAIKSTKRSSSSVDAKRETSSPNLLNNKPENKSDTAQTNSENVTDFLNDPSLQTGIKHNLVRSGKIIFKIVFIYSCRKRFIAKFVHNYRNGIPLLIIFQNARGVCYNLF
jgi:hypothetical protein